MLSVKQGGIKNHFLSLWYEATWDWTLVSRAIGECSTHKANEPVKLEIGPEAVKVVFLKYHKEYWKYTCIYCYRYCSNRYISKYYWTISGLIYKYMRIWIIHLKIVFFLRTWHLTYETNTKIGKQHTHTHTYIYICSLAGCFVWCNV